MSEFKIQIGDVLSNFKLQNQKGDWIEMKNFIGKQPLVIYFYPKDNTPGCTTEACAFRDSYEDFKTLGAEVFGVSGDSVLKHSKFAQQYRLTFDLLSDPKNKICKEIFGVPGSLFGIIPGRATFIFDQAGKLVDAFKDMRGSIHHERALKVLKKLQ